MNKLILNTFAIIMCLLFVTCRDKASYKKQPEIIKKDRMSQSKAIGKEFITYLKGKLTDAIKKSGPHGAIEVCKTASPEAEKSFKEKDTDIISLRRISLKPRNVKDHTPTPNEKDWLVNIENNIKKNIKPEAGLIESTNKTTILLPIIIKDNKCLICHGNPDNFGEELKNSLKKNYPKDQAINYKKGDLRGALVIDWKK